MNAQRTVRLILPGGRDYKHSEWRQVRENIFKYITQRYGGVTTWQGSGWWFNNGVAERESIIICECAVSSWNTEDRQFWIDLAHYARKHLNQEAIMLSVREESSWLVDSDHPLEDPNRKEKQ